MDLASPFVTPKFSPIDQVVDGQTEKNPDHQDVTMSSSFDNEAAGKAVETMRSVQDRPTTPVVNPDEIILDIDTSTPPSPDGEMDSAVSDEDKDKEAAPGSPVADTFDEHQTPGAMESTTQDQKVLPEPGEEKSIEAPSVPTAAADQTVEHKAGMNSLDVNNEKRVPGNPTSEKEVSTDEDQEQGNTESTGPVEPTSPLQIPKSPTIKVTTTTGEKTALVSDTDVASSPPIVITPPTGTNSDNSSNEHLLTPNGNASIPSPAAKNDVSLNPRAPSFQNPMMASRYSPINSPLPPRPSDSGGYQGKKFFLNRDFPHKDDYNNSGRGGFNNINQTNYTDNETLQSANENNQYTWSLTATRRINTLEATLIRTRNELYAARREADEAMQEAKEVKEQAASAASSFLDESFKVRMDMLGREAAIKKITNRLAFEEELSACIKKYLIVGQKLHSVKRREERAWNKDDEVKLRVAEALKDEEIARIEAKNDLRKREADLDTALKQLKVREDHITAREKFFEEQYAWDVEQRVTERLTSQITFNVRNEVWNEAFDIGKKVGRKEGNKAGFVRGYEASLRETNVLKRFRDNEINGEEMETELEKQLAKDVRSEKNGAHVENGGGEKDIEKKKSEEQEEKKVKEALAEPVDLLDGTVLEPPHPYSHRIGKTHAQIESERENRKKGLWGFKVSGATPFDGGDPSVPNIMDL
ncbi:unnamed protein product [Periconia digitata]|uniref:Uncharacterized protein n=1 Tax=Periconia digitata TaxID=1303443 RepID=A0A9W4UDY7_9PLEO|nr:unnamed protein product [Periconia digitata]